MTSASVAAIRPSYSVKVLIPGIVAGIVMALWAMIVEAILPTGAGFWAAPTYISATVLRNLQSVPTPVPFDFGGIVVGLIGHMINSIIFGLIFAYLITPQIRSLGGQVAAGIVYLIVIFLAMWFLIVPAVDPVLLNLNATEFFIGHLIFGAVLGWLNYRYTRGKEAAL